MLINNTLFKIGQAPARFILSFVVLGLLSPALSHAKRDQAEFKQADRIVVVGDIHGDFKKMRQALLLAELIDKRDRWIAGKTRLVQLGDVPDRGPDTLKIIDFLQRLEIKAKRKGGRVHLLIGNHDAMNVYGDLRYVHPGEYKAFETKHSMARLESLYEDEVEWIKENRPEEEWPVFDEEFRTKWFKYRPPGFVEHRVNWLPDGEIGEWILKHNAIVKIGDYLFVHGGIGPQYVEWSIDQLNDAVNEALLEPFNVEGTILRTQEGPLWYRGLARSPEATELEHFQMLLGKHQVSHIIMGHTVTKGVILPRFEGKGIIADVGLSRYYGENLACLLIENGEFYALHPAGRVKIPQEGGAEAVLSYLEEVSRLEPEHEAITARKIAFEKALSSEEDPEELDIPQDDP